MFQSIHQNYCKRNYSTSKQVSEIIKRIRNINHEKANDSQDDCHYRRL